MRNKRISWFLGLTLIAGLAVSVFSARTDIFTLQGGGTLRNIDVFRVDTNADVYVTNSSSYNGATIDSATGELTLYTGDLVLGGIGTVPSQSNYFGVDIPFHNIGAALAQGDVVVASNTGTGYVMKSPATIDLTSVVGVAQGTIASGAVGYIRVAGLAIVKSTGTVAIGDALVSTGTAGGYVGADTTPTTGAKIGVALEAGSNDDTVLAILTH